MLDERHSQQSDAELAEDVRQSSPEESAESLEELYRRHRTAVHYYALTCCRDEQTAEDLTSEAFARTLQAVRSGTGPTAAWRPYLLAVVRRTAAAWADSARRSRLEPDFANWLADARAAHLSESNEELVLRLEERSRVLRAFRTLSERWQAVLWHTVVEEESHDNVGALLGVGASGVGSLVARAREGLREAYLTAHIETVSDSDECRHYSSMLGAAVRRSGRRRSVDLERHLAICRPCREALADLARLNEKLATVLPAGVLLWAGSNYAARLAEGGTATAVATTPTPVAPDGGPAWWTSREMLSGVLAGSVAVAVAGAILLFVMDSDSEQPSRSEPQRAPSIVVETRTLPRATETSASPSPSRQPTKTPKPQPISQKPRKPSPTPSPVGDAIGPAVWSGRLANANAGQGCAEPSGQAVVQNPCGSSAKQVWQVVAYKDDPNLKYLRNSATGQCVDYGLVSEQDYAKSDYVPVPTGPCRSQGSGQLFQIHPHADGSYYLFARREDRPWSNRQLGMKDWWEDGPPPPSTNAEVGMSVNYYDAPRLRYRLDGYGAATQ
ncbi:sigma-70 family RNA polymerase sigma factor [Streptomyces sp. NPDC051907]|uniref:sigma-70 family RNA polymerase sigma factor n=1 Tax=Streptomyces sp. NPDC051907 TaxID=3155284 RepID=UPI003418FDFE